MRFFIERLLGEATFEEKVLAAAALNLYVPNPLRLDVPIDATDEMVGRLPRTGWPTTNCTASVTNRAWPRKLGYAVADTQYAHMVWRLITFQFGRSATRTREPVGPRIWSAVLVSAPLMIMAQVIIYLVAVPLGILCAVNRSNSIDRGVSLALFVLYSIPPFVAGMMFLLFFCYGVFWNWFPVAGSALARRGRVRVGCLAARLPVARVPAGGLPFAVQPGGDGHVQPHAACWR
jgi:hypothetical protein